MVIGAFYIDGRSLIHLFAQLREVVTHFETLQTFQCPMVHVADTYLLVPPEEVVTGETCCERSAYQAR